MDKSKLRTKTNRNRESSEVEQLRNQCARALADYDNLRKRVEIEKELWFKVAAERVVIKLLPVLDSLEIALNHLKDQGLAIAVGEFKKVLFDEGLEEIKPGVGETFDPNLHEVLELVEGDPKDKIAETVLIGWKFKDGPVVRVAKVKVYNRKVK